MYLLHRDYFLMQIRMRNIFDIAAH